MPFQLTIHIIDAHSNTHAQIELKSIYQRPCKYTFHIRTVPATATTNNAMRNHLDSNIQDLIRTVLSLEKLTWIMLEYQEYVSLSLK